MAGQSSVLMGWVHRGATTAGVIFVDLRIAKDFVQVVFILRSTLLP